MKKRTIILIIIAALVLAGTTYGVVSARQRSQASSNDFQTVQINYGELSAVVDETGEVHADQSAILYWETSGIVSEVMVSLGDKVTADQVMAELNEDSLPQNFYMSQQELVTATRALEDLYENAAQVSANAQLTLANARDALEDAEYRWLLNQPGNRYSPEELKSAKAKLVIAEEALRSKQRRFDNADGKIGKARAQILLTDAINQYQYAHWYVNWLQEGADDIEMGILDAKVAVAISQLSSAEREYNRVKDGPDPDDIKMAEARISAAQASLDAAYLTAPFDGVITALEMLPGDLVSLNSIAIRIDNLDNMLVDVAISEVDIIQIDIGQPVTLSFDAIPGKEYTGEVFGVSPVGNLQQGLVSFEVTIKLVDADEDVLPGLTAGVQIVVRQVENVLIVPTRAVRWVNGEQVVYLSTAGAEATMEDLERVPVVLGASSDEFAELLEGDIAEGDYLVLNPPSVSIFDEMDPGGGPPSAFR